MYIYTIALLVCLCSAILSSTIQVWYVHKWRWDDLPELGRAFLLWMTTILATVFTFMFMGARRYVVFVGTMHNFSEWNLMNVVLFGKLGYHYRNGSPQHWFWCLTCLYCAFELSAVAGYADLGAVVYLFQFMGFGIDLLDFLASFFVLVFRPSWSPSSSLPGRQLPLAVGALFFHFLYVLCSVLNCTLGAPLGRLIGVLPLNTVACVFVSLFFHELSKHGLDGSEDKRSSTVAMV